MRLILYVLLAGAGVYLAGWLVFLFVVGWKFYRMCRKQSGR